MAMDMTRDHDGSSSRSRSLRGSRILDRNRRSGLLVAGCWFLVAGCALRILWPADRLWARLRVAGS